MSPRTPCVSDPLGGVPDRCVPVLTARSGLDERPVRTRWRQVPLVGAGRCAPARPQDGRGCGWDPFYCPSLPD
ncbi:hypothetical protein SGPA1_41037 [Streptomyces misionensis JCM 4497]